jgi:hypothetical protein
MCQLPRTQHVLGTHEQGLIEGAQCLAAELWSTSNSTWQHWGSGPSIPKNMLFGLEKKVNYLVIY